MPDKIKKIFLINHQNYRYNYSSFSNKNKDTLTLTDMHQEFFLLIFLKTSNNQFFQQVRDKRSKKIRARLDGAPSLDASLDDAPLDGRLEHEEIALNVAGFMIPKSDAEDLLTNLFRHCALGENDSKERLANSSWKRRESIRGMCIN